MRVSVLSYFTVALHAFCMHCRAEHRQQVTKAIYAKMSNLPLVISMLRSTSPS